jgi:zinc protease
MELISLERSFVPVVSIQCWIRAGSIMESAEHGHPQGAAHFLEHMTFKGTSKRRVGEISATIEGWGGEINAYTTFDRTVYYLTVASEFALDALELLADAVFQSAIDPVEVERERKVILEEISRGLDDPGTRAAQKIFARAYEGSEAGRPVIGSVESVTATTREQLCHFRDTFYRPSNCGFVVVGDVDSEKVAEFLKTITDPLRDNKAVSTQTIFPKGLAPKSLAVELVRGDYQQVRFDFAIPVPELEHVDTPALDMCAYLLGSGDLGLMNRGLRDEQGLVSSAAATLFSPAFPGLFEITILTSDDTALAAIEAVGEILAEFASAEESVRKWGEADLDRAKSAIRADKVFRNETIGGLARVGFGLTTSQKHRYDEVWMAGVERLTTADLVEAWQRWIHPASFHIVGVAPDRLEMSEINVAQAFQRGTAKHFEKAQITRTSTKIRGNGTPGGETLLTELKSGISFIYRQRPGSGLLSLVLATEGGQRAEFGGTMMPGIFNAMASNLARATKKTSYEDCAWQVESTGADLSAFSGKDSLGFRLSCLTQDYEKLSNLLHEMMLEPVFPDAQYESFQREIQEYFRHQADSPASLCIRRLQEAVLGEHPYGNDLAGKGEQIAALSAKQVMDAYHHWLPGGSMVIAGCGDLSADAVMAMLEKSLQGFEVGKKPRSFASDAIQPVLSASRTTIPMDRQQVHMAVAMPGPGWTSPERFAVDVMCNILGGTGGRMFANLRDRDGLAYSVAPILSYGRNRGLLGAYIACSPDKVEAAEAGIWSELEAMASEGPTAAELARAKSYIKGAHVMDLQSSESLASTMALMKLYGVGHNAYQEYPGRIAGVEAKDVTAIARQLLDKKRAQTVLVGI